METDSVRSVSAGLVLNGFDQGSEVITPRFEIAVLIKTCAGRREQHGGGTQRVHELQRRIHGRR